MTRFGDATGVSRSGSYEPSERLSPCFLFAVLVIDRMCEYSTKRPNSFLDISDLIHVGSSLLRETVSNQ